jgi:hypothetical protein
LLSRTCVILLECVKTRQQPFSPIVAAVRVQAPLSAGIISNRENKVVLIDPDEEKLILS